MNDDGGTEIKGRGRAKVYTYILLPSSLALHYITLCFCFLFLLIYNAICDHALEGVDGTIKLMVQRKIEDVALLTNDVILRVAKVVWR